LSQLNNRTLYGYGLGAVAWGVAGQAVSTSLVSQFLFLVVGMPALWIGAAILASQIVDAVVDPFLGLWSDRTHSRLGRRHPFMYVSAVPCALAFLALWRPPTSLAGPGLFAYVLTLLVAVRLFTAMYQIPSAALAPELSRDYDDRTRVFAVRTYFESAAGGLMLILLNVVFLRHDATHRLGVLNRDGYAAWGTIAAAVILISILFSSWSTHHLIPTQSAPVRRTGVGAMLAEVGGTLRNRSFIALVASSIASSIAGGIGAALSPYITLYFFGLSPQVAGLMLFAYAPALFLGAVCARRLATRFGKKQALIGLAATSLISSLAPIGLRLAGAMPANGSSWLIVVLIACNSVNVAVGAMIGAIGASMFADLAEDNAVRTGARAEGFLFALNGLIPKITGGVGALGGSALLTLVRFPAHAQQGAVSPAILTSLGLAYLPVVATLAALSIFALVFYEIDRASHENNLASLALGRPADD
jgi:Na+/melibiose symporter-like transporter